MLYDLGPHLVDLAAQLAGPVAAVRMDASASGHWVTVDTQHDGGAVGQLAMSSHVAGASGLRIAAHGPHGSVVIEGGAVDLDAVGALVRAELAAAVRTGAPVTADALDGFDLACIVDACVRSAGGGSWVDVEHG